ncbi:MAG: tryptophan halogenase family protein [Steroidobacter sp.]
MDTSTRTVIIVGGGSAGWIAAVRIAARWRDAIRVVLIESPSIETIGVGEGTWPTMRNTLRKSGVSETDFLRNCDAAFKQGAKFVRWTDGTDADGYYHPLNPPQGAPAINLSAPWDQLHGERAFADCVDFQSTLCEAGLAPKAITTPEYAAVANYAYHLDAVKFAAFLRTHAVGMLGVEHIVDDVVSIGRADNGDIGNVTLKNGRVIEGDLFIDCTGFSALLIGKTLGVPFKPCGDTLFADRAIALQVPYASPEAAVACHTISTATDAGWIWDIGLPTRRGIGHVYSSRHMSDADAEVVLRRHVGASAAGLNARLIKFHSGYRERFWVGNCVAVGLSAGFLEPLEASALMMIEHSVDFIAERLPANRDVMEILSAQFNRTFTHHWERVVEFLKLHYAISKRDDTAFWRDNRDPKSIPDPLRQRLTLWRHHPPAQQDFSHQPEVFSWPSYQYILHGMRYATHYARMPRIDAEMSAVQRCFEAASRAKTRFLAELPRHRDLLGKVRDYGLQAV